MLKKINTNAIILNSLDKTILKILKKNFIKNQVLELKKIILCNILIKDMIGLTKIWRQVKGYSSNGQRSHSNNKNNKKSKIINNFRLQQFYKVFGKKRRDIFPTLIIGEYTNRLWYSIWQIEWIEAYCFIRTLVSKGKGTVKFDPVLLSKNIITGLSNKKKKKKHNTAKRKIVLVATIGVPLLFTYYLYKYNKKYTLPFTLSINDETRKKMGKKKKK